MTGVQDTLAACRDHIRTRAGGWRIGGGVSIYGHSLFDALVGRHGYFEVLMLEVLGQLPDPRLARWIEASFLCLSFPDARIWCNQIGALAASARVDPTVGIAAGVMASDSALYGPATTRAVCDFLQAARTAVAEGEALEAFLARHTRRNGRLSAPGFARPLATGDDRVPALARVASELGLQEGECCALAWRIDAILQAGGRAERINMLGYTAAFLFDRGLDPAAGQTLYALAVGAGVHACYAEAAQRPAATFLPLTVADIEYSGRSPRPLPEAWAS